MCERVCVCMCVRVKLSIYKLLYMYIKLKVKMLTFIVNPCLPTTRIPLNKYGHP